MVLSTDIIRLRPPGHYTAALLLPRLIKGIDKRPSLRLRIPETSIIREIYT